MGEEKREKMERKKGKSFAERGSAIGEIYEGRTRSSPVDSPVCAYDPKILRSFSLGQASRGSRLVACTAPSRLLFATLERSPCSLSCLVLPFSFPRLIHSPHQFIGFLAARTVITLGRYRAKCAPIELKIGF